MKDRRDYFKNYQRDRRAKSKAEHGNQPASAGKGFSEKQLSQLSEFFDGMAQRLTEAFRGDVLRMLTESPTKESDSVKNVTPTNKGDTVTIVTVNNKTKNQKPAKTKGGLNSDKVTKITVTPRHCQQCGGEMQGKPKKARFCSDHCRYSFHGKAKRGKA